MKTTTYTNTKKIKRKKGKCRLQEIEGEEIRSG